MYIALLKSTEDLWKKFIVIENIPISAASIYCMTKKHKMQHSLLC